MTDSKKVSSPSFNPEQLRISAGIILSAILIAGVIISYNLLKDETPGVELESYGITLAKVRVDAAKNALDGSGEFSTDDCNNF